MNFQRQVSQALDDEHRTNLDLLGRVEQAFARANAPNAACDPALAALAQSLGRHLRHDIGRHFDFEERDLFPLLDDAGLHALKRGVLQLIERQVAHIQKESMALLPMLDDVLDESMDSTLAMAYASG